MKCLYIYILVTMCYGMSIEPKALKAPASLHISIHDDPPSFDVKWDKIDNGVDDPIVGYKVKVLQVKKLERIIYKADSETEEIKKVEIEEYPKIDVHKIPEGNATELIALAQEYPKATFYGLVRGIVYEITVLAFTKKQEGPTSSPLRIRVHES